MTTYIITAAFKCRKVKLSNMFLVTKYTTRNRLYKLLLKLKIQTNLCHTLDYRKPQPRLPV